MAEDGAEQNGAADPVQAFEDLRAEVSVLRKAVEALPRAIRENRPPDYAQDLAILGKGLDEITERLETVQRSPALRMTPEQQGQSIANAGSAMLREATQKFERAAQEAERERYNLARMIGTARAKQDQRFRLTMAGVAGYLLAFMTLPFIVRALPFGIPAGMAATIMNADEWNAGIALLNDAGPQRWAHIVADANLVDANRDKITDCQKDAAKSKKDERCTITVWAP